MTKYIFLLVLFVSFLSASGQTIITVDPTQRYQTIDGWEATTNGLETVVSRDTLLPHAPKLIELAVNEVGITRMRLSVKSGMENPVDYYTLLKNDSITYQEYKTTRYYKVNDNSNPFDADPAGFQTSILDNVIPNITIPMKEAVKKRGDKFYLNLCFVDFIDQSPFHHSSDPEEYAEFMSYIYSYTDRVYNLRPDGVEIILEPDNADLWQHYHLPDLIVALRKRLDSLGYNPQIIAPSVMNLRNIPKYISEIAQNEQALSYLDVISYHRYSGSSDTLAQEEIIEIAKKYNKKTAMLEYDKNGDISELHYDLKYNNNVAWTKYVLMYQSNQLFTYVYVDDSDPENPKYDIAKQTKYLRHYFNFIRPGAVRIEVLTDRKEVDPIAFINPNGKQVVVIKTDIADTILINGLEAGEYGIKYTLGNYNWRDVAPKEYNIDVESQTITGNGQIKFFMPDQGVVTVYQLSDISNVKNNIQENEIIIYPNPSGLYIDIKTETQIKSIFTLSDIIGTQVLSGKINSNNTRIDISQLPTGMYILRIEDKSYKIVKY